MATGRAGEAPVKLEYHLPRPPPVPRLDDRDGGGGGRKKRRKGQNKARQIPFKQPFSSMICQFVNREQECSLKEKCRKMHDKEEYMKQKGQDLGEECVLFSTIGVCPYGIACRYGSSHIDKDHNNIIHDREAMKLYDVKRGALKEVQHSLRSKHVWFPRTFQFLQDNKIDFQDELKVHLKRYRDNKRLKTCNNDTEINKSRDNKENGSGTNGSADHAHLDHSEVYSEISSEYYCLSSRDTRKTLDLRGKLYLSPLTTVGNLPFRRVCKEFGAEVTCGEMALCEELLQGQLSEWALLKRHPSEDIFGVQICGNSIVKTAKVAELINSECPEVDFIDLNVGCPIDLVFNKGMGSALMDRAPRLEQILTAMVKVTDIPISVKMRIGTCDSRLTGLALCSRLKSTGISHMVVHGRTRQQRYTKLANWEYIRKCREAADPVLLFGNGDVFSYEDYNAHIDSCDGIMIGRGALIKPWIFKEIKEQRHWDISSTERMEMLRRYCYYGLEHWGTDTSGVEKTRRFLLEWMSFLFRYIPVGLLEVLPQQINQRPPYYHGRDDTETLMCSEKADDWIKLTEMFLGKVPDGFKFVPKHAANSYRTDRDA